MKKISIAVILYLTIFAAFCEDIRELSDSFIPLIEEEKLVAEKYRVPGDLDTILIIFKKSDIHKEIILIRKDIIDFKYSCNKNVVFFNEWLDFTKHPCVYMCDGRNGTIKLIANLLEYDIDEDAKFLLTLEGMKSTDICANGVLYSLPDMNVIKNFDFNDLILKKYNNREDLYIETFIIYNKENRKFEVLFNDYAEGMLTCCGSISKDTFEFKFENNLNDVRRRFEFFKSSEF
jgi:hypothetical protein